MFVSNNSLILICIRKGRAQGSQVKLYQYTGGDDGGAIDVAHRSSIVF